MYASTVERTKRWEEGHKHRAQRLLNTLMIEMVKAFDQGRPSHTYEVRIKSTDMEAKIYLSRMSSEDLKAMLGFEATAPIKASVEVDMDLWGIEGLAGRCTTLTVTRTG
jgi:hypothetical protein